MNVSFRVRGRVQGVGYRFFALRKAQALGLAGWVRNGADGSVFGEAGGPEAALAGFYTALKAGPPFSSVQSLDWQALDAGESLPQPFEIRP